jgi:hypothetical protein
MMKTSSPGLTCFCLPLAIVTAATLSLASRARGAEPSPVAIRVVEGVRYVPQGNGGAPAVVRSLDITVSNISRTAVNFDLVYAIYDVDSKGVVKPTEMTGVTGEKNKISVTLLPGEFKVFKAETLPTVSELGNSFNQAKDNGSRVDANPPPYVGFYRDHPYWPGGWVKVNGFRVWIPPRDYRREVTAAPTPAKSVDGAAKPKANTPPPTPETYYGYSVAAFVNNEAVAHAFKNPANTPNFGVMYIPDPAPPKADPPKKNAAAKKGK